MYFIFLYIIAGLGAGIVTGLAGLSAAVVITPILVSLGGMDSYDAVAIALSSDVLASALSAYTYYRNKNIDIKRGLLIMGPAFVFTVAGSYAGYRFSVISPDGIGIYSMLATVYLGLKFMFRPITKEKTDKIHHKKGTMLLFSIGAGVIIGIICGFAGAGGGAMMLFVLTVMLGYDLKTAVGTSTMIMTLIALTGAVSHYSMSGTFNLTALVVCMAFTVVGAIWAARFANKCNEIKLNRTVGILLTVLGVVTFVIKFMPV